MNSSHYDAPEDPWGDVISKNLNSSVLFNPSDNPYADHIDIFKKDDESIEGDSNTDNNNNNNNNDTTTTNNNDDNNNNNDNINDVYNKNLEDVDFNSDPFRENSKVYNELSSTINNLRLSPPQLTSNLERDQDNSQSQLKVAFDETPQVIEPTEEEIEEIKAKKQTLLSNLTNIADDEGSPFAASSILAAPVSNGGALFSTTLNDDNPLSDVLNSVSINSNDNDKPVSSSIISPNKKTRMFKHPRTRRLPRSTSVNLNNSSTTTNSTTNGDNNDSKTNSNDKNTEVVDPLLAKSKSEVSAGGDVESVGGSSSLNSQLRNELVKSADAPLFKIDKNNNSTVPRLDASPSTPIFQKSTGSNISSAGSGNTITSSTPKYTPKNPPAAPLDVFEIVVGDPIKVGELTKAHIVYSITTKTKSKLMKKEETAVTRRYRDFLWLYEQLTNNHPGYIIPPPPEKQVYGRFDDKFIENRRLALEKMLIKISKTDVLHNDYDFLLFLSSENFSVEAKERESIHYHGDDPSNENGDNDHLSQSIDYSSSSLVNTSASSSSSGSGGGFFSSITDAFSLSAPKYVETDQYFIDKPTFIENLDSQLKSISKTLDLILGQREEVIASLEELISTIQNFVDLEINNDLSNIFGNFEELQTKIKELLERTNMQQILTIGSTIDEYIRTIGSIRNVFETRFKMCNNILTLQSQSSKKQKNLIKFKSKFHNQVDKIEKYENEIEKLENTISKETTRRDEVTQIIKDQLDKFEYEKVDDFRSMVEIYWEGLCETQKELIELWESFYDQCHFDD